MGKRVDIPDGRERAREIERRYYLRNRERVIARKKAEYQARRDEIREARRQARLNDLDRYRALDKIKDQKRAEARAKWRKANEQRRREYNAEYRAKNAEKVQISSIKYRLKNAEQIRARGRDYYRKNPFAFRAAKARRRARLIGLNQHVSAEQIRQLCVEQDWECKSCFSDIREKYHVDHIIPLSRGGLNTIENIQILCPTCNLRKNDSLPHEWERRKMLIAEVQLGA